MYGNMCVVYTTGIWLLLASFLELPVSTTHSTIGGIVGMAMTYRGPDCVVWYEEADMFPYLKVREDVVHTFCTPLPCPASRFLFQTSDLLVRFRTSAMGLSAFISATLSKILVCPRHVLV